MDNSNIITMEARDSESDKDILRVETNLGFTAELTVDNSTLEVVGAKVYSNDGLNNFDTVNNITFIKPHVIDMIKFYLRSEGVVVNLDVPGEVNLIDLLDGQTANLRLTLEGDDNVFTNEFVVGTVERPNIPDIYSGMVFSSENVDTNKRINRLQYVGYVTSIIRL